MISAYDGASNLAVQQVLSHNNTFMNVELLQSCLFSWAYNLGVCTKPQNKYSRNIPVRYNLSLEVLQSSY